MSNETFDDLRGAGRSRRGRLALAVATLAVLVLAFVILRGGSNDSATTASTGTSQAQAPAATTKPAQGTGSSSAAAAAKPATPVLRVQGGKPVGAVQKLSFKQGDQIRFAVRSTTRVPIHFHGYDIEKEAAPGKPAVYDVKGSISGRFVVEVESTGTQIAEIDVKP